MLHCYGPEDSERTEYMFVCMLCVVCTSVHRSRNTCDNNFSFVCRWRFLVYFSILVACITNMLLSSHVYIFISFPSLLLCMREGKKGSFFWAQERISIFGFVENIVSILLPFNRLLYLLFKPQKYLALYSKYRAAKKLPRESRYHIIIILLCMCTR